MAINLNQIIGEFKKIDPPSKLGYNDMALMLINYHNFQHNIKKDISFDSKEEIAWACVLGDMDINFYIYQVTSFFENNFVEFKKLRDPKIVENYFNVLCQKEIISLKGFLDPIDESVDTGGDFGLYSYILGGGIDFKSIFKMSNDLKSERVPENLFQKFNNHSFDPSDYLSE
ncbi:hypothetical protein HN865_04785 [Candidatus Woesearchaeota archaeon]|jgi:hypothetical protein|nr:hypothetical protein [Candidatus Woesearchaeota archaeon]